MVILLATRTSSLALPQTPADQLDDPCAQYYEYRNLKQGQPFGVAPRMVGGECTSSLIGGCEVSRELSHSTGIEMGVSVDVSGGFDFAKIFNLGVSAGFSYSWSTQDGTAVGTASECPEGGLHCGAIATEQRVQITGERRLPPGGLGCPGDNDWHAFDFTAPFKENKDAQPSVNFEICLLSCGSAEYPDSCDIAYPADGPQIMKVCPSSTIQPCSGGFGGTCGTTR
ncbi:hypothetical protein EJ04DRAFT_508656 [Polyplosphaeria fusca]|uniref:Uncharacterized protein n=1 Tax=Polyplosphaeria fusca TaxID=682080 RepID=A0A9P4V6G9_9PLEO|nr:hypothetical protein EJ04DRAFT_508656 [Polyplosphaeria fusca]